MVILLHSQYYHKLLTFKFNFVALYIFIVTLFCVVKCCSSTIIASKNHKDLKSDYLKPFYFGCKKTRKKDFTNRSFIHYNAIHVAKHGCKRKIKVIPSKLYKFAC